MVIRRVLIILSITLIVFLGLFEINVTDGLNHNEIITKGLYDEWYFQQSTWSIEQFPSETKEFSGADYAWGWSYTANSLIDMFHATRQDKYLEFFIPQAEYILNHTDVKLGVESFANSGLSLPAWSDRARYTSGKFNYTYPVHTGMIVLPILRFIDVVEEYNLSKYSKVASKFLLASGQALAIHNQPNLWVDITKNEGFYKGHPYGEALVSEANKIGVPNRIFVYLAACGLYDKLTEGELYTKKIEKSLRYFKNSLIEYDKSYDTYYWSYWEVSEYQFPWEDISHASLTIYGLFILHEEANFNILNDKDLRRMSNIINKMVKDGVPPEVRKNIHNTPGEKKVYFNKEENPYYYDILRLAFLGIYNKEVFDNLKNIYAELYFRGEPSNTNLFSLSTYLYTQNKIKE